MKYQKGTIEQLIIFSLSPFFSLPIIIYNLQKNNKFSYTLISILLGLISYLYIPAFSNDKTRYLERVVRFRNFDLTQFSNYILDSKKPDFVFDLLIYLFSSNNISVNFLFFFISFFSVFTVFFVFRKILINYTDKINLFSIFFVFLSISLPGLFSGLRFAFGSTMMLWAIYFLLFNRKLFLGILFSVLAVLTHFSMILLVPSVFFIKYFRRINAYKLFLISLVFLFISEFIFSDILSQITFFKSYANKINDYTGNEDFLTSGFQRNIANLIMYYIKNIWIYIAYAFLIFNKKYDKEDLLTKLLFILIAVVNLTYSFTTVFARYSSFIKFIFIVFLIKQYFLLPNKNRKIYYLFFIIFFFSFLADVYKLRFNLQVSLFKNLTTLVNVLSVNIGLSDVIPSKF